MAFQVVQANELDWRVTNPLGVADSNLTGVFGFAGFAARAWWLNPDQAMPRHRHRFQTELYVVLEGRGRLRVEGTLLELASTSAVLVDPDSLRRVFNDTDAAATLLIVGAPPEQITISDELHATEHRHLYPGGITDLPRGPRAGGPRDP
jgi:quercetin dioxygenase-like cupin family protein